jgi:macrolide transport system ATP-binding/permease protein
MTPPDGQRAALDDASSSRIATADRHEPLIELSDVRKTFMRGEVAVEALRGVSFRIDAGEFVAIMGQSGSGKSTLMNLIGLLDRPTSGSYKLFGREVAAFDDDQRALFRREAFGFIFQQYNLLGTADATENVEIPAIYKGMTREAREVRARELLTLVGLGERLDHRPNQLSGGQQQRVSIARALMNGGPIILADEPTGALDSKSGREIMALLKDLNAQGHTIILITHDRQIAEQADRIIEISDGMIVSDHKRADAIARPPAATQPAIVHVPATPRLTALDVRETLRMAAHALRVNLLRTMLTLLGIIIGVASVVSMLAIGDGAKRQVLDSISAMGTNLLLIRPGAPNIRMTNAVRATLVMSDVDALKKLPNVKYVVPEFPQQVTVRYGKNDYVTQINGTSEDYPLARDWPAQQGTFFSAGDVSAFAPVVVLGITVVKALYLPEEDPIGTTVLVNNAPFLVVGVMSAKGAGAMGNDMDDVLFTPITTGRMRVYGQTFLRSITVAVDDVSKIDETQEALTQLLTARHKVQDFQVRNMASIIDTATATQDTLTVLLGSIACISLIVGGIGVMNIMLVSVTERTREIGIRMATGARRANIVLQFNAEALAVCALGGLIGVALGLAVAALFDTFGRPIAYSVWPVVLAFGCSLLTGLLFGYLPARKAAQMDPVVALGAE